MNAILQWMVDGWISVWYEWPPSSNKTVTSARS